MKVKFLFMLSKSLLYKFLQNCLDFDLYGAKKFEPEISGFYAMKNITSFS